MLYHILLPILLTFLPWVVARFIFKTKTSTRLPYLRYASYLWSAAIIWLLALVIPNIPLTVESDTTSMHLLGGVVAGLLWLYALKAYRVHFAGWWQAPLSLYLFVGGLGVFNELLEIFLNTTGIARVYNYDAQWDLLANTLGAGVFFAVYSVIKLARK